jgi:hypothetical protein
MTYHNGRGGMREMDRIGDAPPPSKTVRFGAPRGAASNVRKQNTRDTGMRTAKYFTMAVLTMGLLAGLGMFRAADDKPKLTIEEIMEKAHKGKPSLFKKVVEGKADKEQKQQLLEYYQELAKNKPEKGELSDWKKRTSALVAAAKGVVADKEGANKQLAKAASCKACHELHKGD